MTTTEITEGNKLIADFMGVKETVAYYDNYGQQTPCYYTDNNLYRSPTFGSPNKSLKNFLGASKYHESWDWLMPVVEKIEAMGFDIHIDPKNRCMIFNGNKNVRIDTSIGSKIESVWCAVIAFIKWYNTQKS